MFNTLVRGLDNLPPFQELISDHERERKASLRVSGTFIVIVNQQSFSELYKNDLFRLPNTQNHDAIIQSSRHRFDRSYPGDIRDAVMTPDPDIVILSRFEDVALDLENCYTDSPKRSPRYSTGVQQMKTLSPLYSVDSTSAPYAESSSIKQDQRLIDYYSNYVSQRVAFPSTGVLSAEKLRMTIIETSQNFAPLHHVICALGLLDAHYEGQVRLEDVLQRNLYATECLRQAIISHHDLNSVGIFLFHFISLIYEFYSPPPSDTLWINHFEQMQRIAQVRRKQSYSHTFEFIMASSLVHDIHARLATHAKRRSGRPICLTEIPMFGMSRMSR
jgi:hypothetical protein